MKILCVFSPFSLTNVILKTNQPELLDEAFGMLRDQAENATVSFSLCKLKNFFILQPVEWYLCWFSRFRI
jgi:hypothetical protein